MRTQYDADDVQRVIMALADRVAGSFSHDQPLGVIGIRTRGEVLGRRLTAMLAQRGFTHLHQGVLDITLYRDDLSEIGPAPLVRPTTIDFNLDRVPILLVDDVLFTGRSVRAALNALSDFGRPGAIRLAVLIDRGGRELPIQSDFTGLTLTDIPANYRVKVRLTETDGADEIIVGAKNP